MNDRLLAEALRSRQPGAPAAVYDAYADRLYDYCWFRLLSRDQAEEALRETFIVAQEHIGKLRDTARFAAWLYAAARLECERRGTDMKRRPDIQIAGSARDDGDKRMVAWRAVRGLSALSREALDLRHRQSLDTRDVAAVLGLQHRDVPAVLDRAAVELEMSVTAELLVLGAAPPCPVRAAVIPEVPGELTVEARYALLRHASVCERCRSLRPRSVAAEKVFGLLPRAVPPPALRARLVDRLLERDIVDHRRAVAGTLSEFDGARRAAPLRIAPPRTVRDTGGGRRTRRATARKLSLATAALAAAGLLIGAAAWSELARQDRAVLAAEPGGAAPPWTAPRSAPGMGAEPAPSASPTAPVDELTEVLPVSATFPMGSRTSAAPPAARLLPGASQFLPGRLAVGGQGADRNALFVAPLHLDLTAGKTGTVTVQAENAAVRWRARGSVMVEPARTEGRLAAGGATKVTIRVLPSAPPEGRGSVVFQPGGQRVTVVWRVPAEPEPPAPIPDDPFPAPPVTTAPSSPSAPVTEDPGPGSPSGPPPPEPVRPPVTDGPPPGSRSPADGETPEPDDSGAPPETGQAPEDEPPGE